MCLTKSDDEGSGFTQTNKLSLHRFTGFFVEDGSASINNKTKLSFGVEKFLEKESDSFSRLKVSYIVNVAKKLRVALKRESFRY